MSASPKDLPQIEALLRAPEIVRIVESYSRAETTAALQQAVGEWRTKLLSGEATALPDFHGTDFGQSIAQRIKTARALQLRPLINATGILIHTNLGRAPLAPQAIAAMQAIAENPSNLEFNLDNGKRGSRHAHVEALICKLTGAEAAVVVNNCAAAVLLSLMATAQGRNVIASRGELIEIGGSFRLPDVIAQSGAHLREVGATNKTRISDYADAIDADTAVLLKSHTSNFRIVGFTAAPDRRDLAALAKERDVILMEDLGSGVLLDLAAHGLGDEPVVSDILKTGVDLVMFSGDKLLGGPQAGILAGRADIIAELKAHPLMRAVRIDKLSLAALEATLRLYVPPHDPMTAIPVLQMLSEPIDGVKQRADRVCRAIADLGCMSATVMESTAQVGAGAFPETDLPSAVVTLAHPTLTAEGLSAALRAAKTPVVGRIAKDHVLLDMRTVRDPDVPALIETLQGLAP